MNFDSQARNQVLRRILQIKNSVQSENEMRVTNICSESKQHVLYDVCRMLGLFIHFLLMKVNFPNKLMLL